MGQSEIIILTSTSKKEEVMTTSAPNIKGYVKKAHKNGQIALPGPQLLSRLKI
jgi:hypothetical protein